MKQTLSITRKQAEAVLRVSFPKYSGRRIKLEFVDKVSFWDTNWSGGTKNEYAFVRADGLFVNLAVPAPWVNPIEGKTFPLPENVLVVEHSYFCGKDTGIHIYAHPCHLPKWLREVAE